jgi:uncharacterized phiE125 gp8 family phage protein
MAADGPGAVTLGAEDRAAAVADVKALLGVTQAEADGIIATLAETALGLAEAFTGQVTIARAMTVTVDAACGWTRLPATPVSAITAVAAVGGDGTATPLPSGGYAIDIDAAGDGWVRMTGGMPGRLAVGISAGLAADWASMPAALRHGAATLAAYLYDHRDGAGAPPAAVTALWRPFRRMRIADRVPA